MQPNRKSLITPFRVVLAMFTLLVSTWGYYHIVNHIRTEQLRAAIVSLQGSLTVGEETTNRDLVQQMWIIPPPTGMSPGAADTMLAESAIIQLQSPHVTREQFVGIWRQAAHLKNVILMVNHSRLTDADLAIIGKADYLRGLVVDRRQFTDELSHALHDVSTLIALGIFPAANQSEPDNTMLSPLEKHTHVRRLYIRSNALSNDTLDIIAQMPSLSSFVHTYRDFALEKEQQLRKRRSGLRMERHDPKDDVMAVAMEGDGERMAAVTCDGKLYLWNRTGKLTGRFDLDTQPLYAVKFHPTRPEVIVGGDTGRVSFLDLATDPPILRHQFSSQRDVSDMALHGEMMVTTSSDASVVLWNLRQRAVERTLTTFPLIHLAGAAVGSTH